MELSQLRYFVAVAEAQSISRAAQILRIVQPAVSRQIRKLELELGQRLFHRSERGVELTSLGREYLNLVKSLLRQLDDANEAMRSGVAPGNTLHLGIVQLAQWYPMVTRAIAAFRKIHGGTRLEVLQMPSSDQVRALIVGEIDVAIGVPLVDLPTDMERIVLFSVPRGIVLSAAHELAAADDISIADIDRFPLITTSRSTWTGNVARFFPQESGEEWAPSFSETFDNLSLLLSRVKDNASIAIIPQPGPDAPMDGLVFRQVSGMYGTIDLTIYWRSQEEPTLASDFVRLFISADRGLNPVAT